MRDHNRINGNGEDVTGTSLECATSGSDLENKPIMSSDTAASSSLQGEIATLQHESPEGNPYSSQVTEINSLFGEMEKHLASGVRGCLYSAYRIGLIVQDTQDQAPSKKKTAAVNTLASHPDIRLSRAQLYRYLNISRNLHTLVGVPPEIILSARKKEFFKLVGALSLSDALALIVKEKERISDKTLGYYDGNGRSKKKQSTLPADDDAEAPDGWSASYSDDEWITPPEIVTGSIGLLGGIDLDPCGGLNSAFHLPSARTLTPADDALTPELKWEGKLFVHPPASQVAPFVRRAQQAFLSRESSEVLLLTPAEMDAPHMQWIQPYAKAFFYKRPQFALPSGDIVVPPWPFMLVFLTREAKRSFDFAEAFGHMAGIYLPHHLWRKRQSPSLQEQK